MGENRRGFPVWTCPASTLSATAAGYGVDAHEAHTTDEVTKLVEVGIADRERPTLINARIIPVNA